MPDRAEHQPGDGRRGVWRLGHQHDVDWIVQGGPLVLGALPPIFDAFATVRRPLGWDAEAQVLHDRSLVGLLRRHAADSDWWLGYLDTGADDVVVPEDPGVRLYFDWRYIVIEGGPEEALTLRHTDGTTFWKGATPNLFFPQDRSWLASTLWDDDWTCIGGSHALIAELVQMPGLRAETTTR